jgi:hypothetical protein
MQVVASRNLRVQLRYALMQIRQPALPVWLDYAPNLGARQASGFH